MIKIAGIILISGAVAMAGSHKAFVIKEGILIRKALYELILHIKSSIEASSQELSLIYAAYNSEILEKTGFMTSLNCGCDNALEHALKSSSLRIPESLAEIYGELALSLGKSRSGKTESELLARYIKAIEKEEEKLIKNDEAKLVLYKKLGILAGLFAALILV